MNRDIYIYVKLPVEHSKRTVLYDIQEKKIHSILGQVKSVCMCAEHTGEFSLNKLHNIFLLLCPCVKFSSVLLVLRALVCS